MIVVDECEGIWKKTVMAYRTFQAFNPRVWGKLGNCQDTLPAGKGSNLRLQKYAADVVGTILGISAFYPNEYW